jgi:monoamine oxidase
VDFDVAIVGGGLAGLSAARDLTRAGLSVTVLEASDRPGGRVKNQTLAAGIPVESGAAFVGPTQDEVLRLIGQLGLQTFKAHHEGEDLVRRKGRIQRYGSMMPVGALGLADTLQSHMRLDGMARGLPRETPWTARNAKRLDGQSLGEWVRRHTHTDAAAFLLDISATGHFLGSPDDLSLLAYLTHVNSAGGMRPLREFEGGAQEQRVVGGSGLIGERCAAQLGDAVRLDSPVNAVNQLPGHVELLSGGEALRTRRVIVAVDPCTCEKIDFTPPLPADRRRLQAGFAMGACIKFHLAYETPFWRRGSLSGLSFSDTGTVRMTIDMSPPEAEPGVLMGSLARSFCDDEELLTPENVERRRAAIVADLVELFGPQASAPIDYVEQDWSAEPYVAGCTPVCPPGLLTSAGPALRAPVDRIHWAGAESSPIWEAHMDGAIRSGKRAASEVTASLESRARTYDPR